MSGRHVYSRPIGDPLVESSGSTIFLWRIRNRGAVELEDLDRAWADRARDEDLAALSAALTELDTSGDARREDP